MSILTKGMYMPPSCYFCPMTNDGLYLCKANNPYRQLEDDCEECKPQWCPLLPVPEHGRLIDADALEASCFMGSSSFYTQSDIDYATTIIPAEEGKNEADL